MRSNNIYVLNVVLLISSVRLSPKSVVNPWLARYSRNFASSSSKSRDLSGMSVQEMIPPTAANAAPIRNTAWTPLKSSEKESWMGVNTWVPIAAPAFPTAAAKPKKCPRIGVGKLSAPQRKVATPGPLMEGLACLGYLKRGRTLMIARQMMPSS